MNKLKTYKQFFEDGTACVNASVGGMGNVVNATVGTLPGVPGSSGSGYVSFTLGGVSTKQPVGGPTEVSDLRYLEEEDDIEEVDDLKNKKKSK